MFYVYAIQSLIKKSWLYIGYSDDLKKRITAHDLGKVTSTKGYRPFRLVYYEAYTNELVARRREYELKHNNQQKEILKARLGESLA